MVDKKIQTNQTNDKKGIHGPFYTDVQVECVCEHTFTIDTTVPGPIRVEICPNCHPAYNKNRVIKKVVKGRMEKFLEKQKKMASLEK